MTRAEALENKVVQKIVKISDQILVERFSSVCLTPESKKKLDRLEKSRNSLRVNFPDEWEIAGLLLLGRI